MQGEKSTYNLNDFAKKKRKNSNSDKSHPFVYAEPLDLIFSLSWKTKQWLSDFNESSKEKKAREEVVLPNSIYSHDYATYGPEL